MQLWTISAPQKWRLDISGVGDGIYFIRSMHGDFQKPL